MTESNTKPQGILLRVEMVQARMQSWGHQQRRWIH
jgi:hypothetical protein